MYMERMSAHAMHARGSIRREGRDVIGGERISEKGRKELR